MKKNNTTQTISKNTIQSGVKILAAAAIYVALQGCLGAGNNRYNLNDTEAQRAAREQAERDAAELALAEADHAAEVAAKTLQDAAEAAKIIAQHAEAEAAKIIQEAQAKAADATRTAADALARAGRI